MLGLAVGVPFGVNYGVGFDPLTLYTGALKGMWTEQKDPTTLFQDSQGATPVTTAGQPEGLVLDKRLGLALGSDRVLNGTFADASAWGTGVGVTISGGSANYVNVIALDDSLYQPAVFVGGYFEVTYTVFDYVSGSVRPYFAGQIIGGLVSANGTYTVRALDETNAYLIFKAGVNGTTLKIDNVSVKEVQGNHLKQATAAARPVYAVSPSSATFDGIDDALSTATFAAGTLTANMDCFIAVKRNAAGAVAISYDGTVATRVFSIAESGSALSASLLSGTPTYLVNGVAVPGGTLTTRDQLNTAMPLSQWLVLEVRNLDLSAWVSFSAGALATFILNGNTAGVILCEAQTDAKRSQIRTYLGNQVGLTL